MTTETHPMPTPPSAQARTIAGRMRAELGPLVSLAVPLIGGLTTSTLPGLVDTYMLGGLGTTVLGAVSLTTSVLLIFYAGLYGCVGPVGILVGNAYGAGQPGAVAGVIRHGLVMALLAGLGSLALMTVGLLLLPSLDQPPEVLAVITPYWVAMSLALIPYALGLVFKQFYDAIDRPWLGFWLTLTAVLANIGANWVLIYGNLGFPALGLAGAGIGSLIGQLVGLTVMAAYYRFARSTAAYRTAARWSLQIFRDQFREGVPMGIQYVLEGGAVAVAGVMIGWLGTLELAAAQIVDSVTSLLYMLPLGMAGAVTIRVAQAAGAGAHGRLPSITYTALAVVTVWMVSFTALLLLAGEGIAALFVTEPELIAVAGTVFVTVGLMQVFDGVQSVSLGALRGILDNGWPTVVSLIGYWLIALPASYVIGVALETGAAGVWTGFALGLVFASVMLVVRIRRQFRRLAQPGTGSPV
ncbi:MAG: MATE family efflux transporter [Chloroflexi bacterium]|nr:MATE family efflux transporter [Chloroflexota bacterium]